MNRRRHPPYSTLGRARRRATLVAILVAAAMLALTVLPLLAFADDGAVDSAAPGSEPVPDEVATVLEVDPSAVRTVWLWSTGFLQGDPDAEPVVAADQWVASAPTDGAPVGTRTAWRDPDLGGEIALAATDDHARLAAALGTLGPDELLVTDRGEWLVLHDATVRSLLDDDLATLPEPVPLAEFQVGRAADYAEDLGSTDHTLAGGGGAPAQDDEGPALSPRVVVAAVLTVSLVVALLLAVREHRRTRRGR